MMKESGTGCELEKKNPGVDAVKLKRQLELHHGVAIICGLIIGTGIFVSPAAVVRGTQSVGLTLVLWVVAGVVATTGALSFAELGTMFPRAGEKYVYLQETMGTFWSFLYLWGYLLIFRPTANAMKCITFGLYIVQPLYTGCHAPRLPVTLIAILVACVVTTVNCINVKLAARGQTFTTCTSILSLLLITVLGFVHMSKEGGIDNLQKPFDNTNNDIGDIVLGFYGCVFTIWGWSALNFLIEELKDPVKNLPRAIVISMAIVTTLYTLVNLSYLTVMGLDGVSASEAVAVEFFRKTLGVVWWIMPVFIVITLYSSLNSGTFVFSRLCFAGARNGHLPEVLSHICLKTYTPIVALLLQLVIMICMCLIGDVYFLMNNMVFVNSSFEALTAGGLLYLRWKKPELHRPVKMPLFIPITFLVSMLFLTIIPLVTKPRSCVIGVAMSVSTGITYYILFIKRPFKLTIVQRYWGKFLVSTLTNCNESAPIFRVCLGISFLYVVMLKFLF